MSIEKNPREHFTSDELVALFREMGIEAEYEFLIDEDDGDVSYVIDCVIGELKFRCSLGHSAPLFEELMFIDVRAVDESPYKFFDRFNDGRRVAVAKVLKDDDGGPTVDADGEFWIGLTMILPCAGGVTDAHLRFMINMWIEDLLDFHELDDEAIELMVAPTDGPSIVPGTPLERIESCLSVLGPQTARQLAHNLDSTKNEVNAILYKHSQLFSKSQDQPPLWSLIET